MVHVRTRRCFIGLEFDVLGSVSMTALTFVQAYCSPDVMLDTGNISVGGCVLDDPDPNTPILGMAFIFIFVHSNLSTPACRRLYI
jgi:hypothetical protein